MKSFSKALLVIALGAALTAALAPCGAAKAAEKTYKDTIVWGQGADVTSFDPHQGKETPAVTVTCQIFDTLTAVDPATGEVRPQIAESWEQLDDTTYVFHIRKGIKFHNGGELTAADVKFSLDRAIAFASVSYIVDFIKEVNVKDDFTVEVVLRAPYAPALRNLAVPFAAIVCKEVVEKDEEGFKLHPVGSGPYKFVEWKPGDTVKLDAFDDYMDGRPATPHLVMKVVPETSQRLIALETGDLDISYDLGVNDVKRARDNEDVVVLEAPSLSCWYISMNMNRKPFDDPRVREAVNYAIDRQLIVDTIMSGNGQAADAIIAPSVFGYYPSGVYGYDPEKARELLKEAGYENGFKTTLWVNDNQSRIEICQAVQAMLLDIGVDCSVEVMEFGSFIQKTTAGEHDMGFFGWTTSTRDADYTYYSLEHSSKQGASGNRSFVHDPGVDKLVEGGRTISDPEQRKAIYKDLALLLKKINNNAPIYYSTINVGARKGVEGFVIDPVGYHELGAVRIPR
ncbi:peptide-binding protein [Pyramidobacter sp. SM-530-WT-4B]|uniref:Peptide-binding protein n=1 Tax=Pyramidobacter porci TaxID=2605789 RepID=A0A6L5YCX8_9BACT|nr:ABC transporter substrate-binding protein [Pyramidobacter porci]MST56050.1 peptide-binding protein [Pyramidobacter porci]